MSESPQDRPDEVDENAPKPGEPDTETVGRPAEEGSGVQGRRGANEAEPVVG
jgi:hypothetical protein